MDKLDFKKDQRELYLPPAGGFRLVTVPSMRFLQVDGSGEPGSAAYTEAVQALYSGYYAVKSASKALGRDYVVGPLEGLWWAADMTAFTRGAKAEWSWTMMIRQPDWFSAGDVAVVLAEAGRKKKLPLLRHAELEEGLCAQALHVGPYDQEGPALARLHGQFLPEHHLEPSGKHHEIYLGDPRKTEPAKLRTVLRQPVRPRE